MWPSPPHGSSLSRPFRPGEVSEIWLTFSDPQLKSENSRLTSPLFLSGIASSCVPAASSTSRPTAASCMNIPGQWPSKTACGSSPLPPICMVTGMPTRLPRAAHSSRCRPSMNGMFLKQRLQDHLSVLHPRPRRALSAPSDFDSDYWRSVEGPRQILRNV